MHIQKNTVVVPIKGQLSVILGSIILSRSRFFDPLTNLVDRDHENEEPNVNLSFRGRYVCANPHKFEQSLGAPSSTNAGHMMFLFCSC
jgi:hypothetical protein